MNRNQRLQLAAGALLLFSLACSLLPGSISGGGTQTSVSQDDTGTVTQAGGEVIAEDGAVVTFAPGSLSAEAQVEVSLNDTAPPPPAGSPMQPTGPDYRVDFAGANQTGKVTMTVPLTDGGGVQSQQIGQVYFAWAEPAGGIPNALGVLVEDGSATFPLVGEGNYQLYQMPSSDALQSIVSVFEPLTVPTYRQLTSSWCSPTALTDLVQYHQGAWPVGGLGSAWGETSNWYLAGQASQPANSGFFFHWLLGAGGYNVPSDVRQSFTDGNAEVVIWNWNSAVIEINLGLDGMSEPTVSYLDTDYAIYLYDAFKAYVEHYFWGQSGEPQPVAWGSNLDGHSRVLTGSNGTTLYYNDPGSGSFNQSRTWESHRSQVMTSLSTDSLEIIDTVVIHEPARPQTERRGVLWLHPSVGSTAGSVRLVRGDGATAADWHWDGSGSRENGYYYDDPLGQLPAHSAFDHAFSATGPDDKIVYAFTVRSISDFNHDFTVDLQLSRDGAPLNLALPDTSVSLPPKAWQNVSSAGEIMLSDLQPGLHTMRFRLLESGVVQDVKYVQFQLNSLVSIVEPPIAILNTPAFCRIGPGPLYPDVTAYDAGKRMSVLGLNPEQTWMRGQDEALGTTCWISLDLVDLNLDDLSAVPVLQPPPLPTPTPVPDTTPPSVSISHSPNGSGEPSESQQVTFTASASDNVAVAEISILVRPPGGSWGVVKTCSDSTQCVYSGGPYPSGELSYDATAIDSAGTSANAGEITIPIWAVIR